MIDTDLEAASAALVSLACDNIPPDVQELLVRGDPQRDIRPGAFSRAIQAALIVYARHAP
jgi:hypothetical protein